MPGETMPFTGETVESPHDGLSVEIRPSFTGNRAAFDLFVVRGQGGMGLGIPIRTLTKARRIARFLIAVLGPEYVDNQERLEASTAAFMKESQQRWAEQRIEAERAQAERLAKITSDTPLVHWAQCPSCEHMAQPVDFEDTVYECSRCGETQIGDQGNRCETDNIFMAKIGNHACPSCQEALEDEPDLIDGYDVDGVFVPKSEVQA